MTRSLMARRGWAALITATTVLLAACGSGGGNDGGNAQWRILNLATDVASVDVYAGVDKQFTAVNNGALTSYQSIESNSYSIKLVTDTGTTAVMPNGYSLSKDQHYTGIVWGGSASLGFATLPEDGDASGIGAGTSLVRVFNATNDALDIYLTQNVDDIGDATPTVSNATSITRPGGFRTMSTGTYRLRVTGTGTPTDLRLDIASVTLTEKQFATIVITSGTSGYLVNGALLVQQGAITQLPNTFARLRVAAGAESSGVVSVQLDGAPFSALKSPAYSDYEIVPAGARSIDVLVDGSTITSGPQTRTLAAGGDYTLLAYGASGAGHVQFLDDDNRLPTAGKYRIRLVNGAVNADPASLKIDFLRLVSNVAVGTGSSYVSGTVGTTSSTTSQLDVLSSLSGDTYYTNATFKVQSLGVYTVFLLGGDSTPGGKPSKDR